MTENNQATTGRLRYVVVGEPNPGHLPMGTRLDETRRFDGWDYHGCIDPVRTVVGEMSVASGPRTGETVEVTLESGYEYDPPIWKATWLVLVPNDPPWREMTG